MKFATTANRVNAIEADAHIIFIIAKDSKHQWAYDSSTLEELNFSMEQSETCYIQSSKRLYVGVDKLEHNSIRNAASSAIKALKSLKIKSAKIGSYSDESPTRLNRAVVEGAVLGSYSFENYKSKKSQFSVEKITISTQNHSGGKSAKNELDRAIKIATITAKATNSVRDIVNTAPQDFIPTSMAKLSIKMAKADGLECRVLKKSDLKREGMNAFLAVNRASINPPRLIHLTYKPKKPLATIALIGKGLTYDSGGLSLKPSASMVNMKLDKAGASALYGVMQAVARLNLPIEVHAFLGMAENMVGGNAYKPDDILKTKNGKTVEVRNTDAEGRLILADVLSYAQQEVKADYFIDYATLTGACLVAFGPYTSAVMGNSKELIDSFMRAADSSGELVGTLPFNDHLREMLKSEVADISNIGSSSHGGAITGALFLDNFIDNRNKNRWLHVDMAGPAFSTKAWDVNPYGASGAGVRVTLKWMEHLIKKLSK